MEGYNIAIVGKSGVGKSSLLNYLFGKDITKTGSGRPQTVKGFHKHESVINNKKVNIYDSWGLEAGKSKEWLNEFKSFQKDKKEEEIVSKWIHSVIYCISGSGKRIEDFELKIINAIKKEGLSPVIVITKSDSSEINEFSIEIERITNIKPILVSSVKKKNFGGTVHEFGKERLIQGILNSSIESFDARFKVLFENKIKREKIKLDEQFIKSFSFYLLKKSIKGKVSKNDIKEIEKLLRVEVQKSQVDFQNSLDEYISNAETFYKRNIVSSFDEKITKNINLNFNISADFDFDFLDLLGVLFFPLAIIRFFSRTPKENQKVYQVDEILKIFNEKNYQDKNFDKNSNLTPIIKN